jgi:hypothetical protein
VNVCDKTCIFFFFPIINKYFLMAKRSLLSRFLSYMIMIFNFTLDVHESMHRDTTRKITNTMHYRD